MILINEILNIVRVKVSPVLDQYGFTYASSFGKEGIRYERKTVVGSDYITFSINPRRDHTLRVEFSTTIDHFDICGSNFVKNPDVSKTGYWSYDDGSVHNVIQELLDITINYGLPWFEQKNSLT
jgi:hypothetical protein